MVKIHLATETTDSKGETSTTYTGVGGGQGKIIAELHDDDTVQSEPYPLLDAIFYDDGVTSPKTATWNNELNQLDINIDSNGTLLTANTNTGLYTASSVTTDFICEFDLVSYSDTRSPSFRILGDDTTSHYFIYKDLSISANSHIKFVYENGVFKYQVNDGSLINWVTASYSSVKLSFRIAISGNTTKFKNFKLYPI